MKKFIMATIVSLAVAAFSTGCAYAPTWVGVGTRVYQRSEIELFAVAKSKIPLLPIGYTRIYIYRPQVFVGMFGSAVVIINGKWMGDIKDPFDDNLLLPGAVFVVDSPVDVTRVWWYQTGKGEEAEKALLLKSTETRTWYLRWGMKPTYGYLETVSEQQALTEIEPLRFTGYVRLESR